jgi:type II secretory pathway component HofQ
VLPLVAPLVNQRGGTVTGTHNQLIINTPRESLAEIKLVLATIDKAPRQLMITVKTDDAAVRSRSEAEIAANVGSDKARVIVPGSGDRTGATVEGRDKDDSLRARVSKQEARTRENNLQQVRVLEGNAAFIAAGQSVPLSERTITNTPYGTHVTDSTQYRDLATGFYVLPRVSGEIVTLEISRQREAFNNRAMESRHVNTRVSAKLGEWIQIAGVDEAQSGNRSALAARSSASRQQRGRVWLKVEESP